MPDEGVVEVSDEGGKEAAAEAKARGTAHFTLGTAEGYKQAIHSYQEAEKHDPTDHVFPSNICASYLELAKLEWEPAKKVEHNARALMAAQRCVAVNPSWFKGLLRKATAEGELLSAAATWEERKADRKDPVDFDGNPWPSPDPSVQPTIDGASHASVEATCRAALALDRSSAVVRLRLQRLRDDGHVGADKEAADRALVDVEAAAPLKAEGNAAFSAKRFEEAAEKYTAALSWNPFDHVFYSNRSACHAGAGEEKSYELALRDADSCIRLMPSFAKGFSRRSAAAFGLGRYPEAEAAAAAGLALDPASEPLKELLAAAKVETAETPAVQAEMHRMRCERAKNEKLKKVLSGLNLGGNVQMFGPGGGGGGLDALFGGGGGGFGGNMGGGLGGMAQTDEQMRQMARAIGGLSSTTAASGGAAAEVVDVE